MLLDLGESEDELQSGFISCFAKAVEELLDGERHRESLAPKLFS
jgi:hypothetical protein